MASGQWAINGGVLSLDSVLGNGNRLLVGLTAKVMAADANDSLTAAQCAARIIVVTSGVSLTALRNIVMPTVEGGQLYLVSNQTTGGQSIKIIGASGTGATVATGKVAWVFCDGTNFVAGPST